MSTNSKYMVFHVYFIAYEKEKNKEEKYYDIIKSKLEQ